MLQHLRHSKRNSDKLLMRDRPHDLPASIRWVLVLGPLRSGRPLPQTGLCQSPQRDRSGRSRFLLAFIHSSQKGRCLLGRRQGRAAVTATACNTRTHRGCNRRPNPNCSFLKVLQSIRSATPTELVRSRKCTDRQKATFGCLLREGTSVFRSEALGPSRPIADINRASSHVFREA